MESLQKIATDQASLAQKFQANNLNDLTVVVRLGNCDYFHAFHADCVENHFKSVSDGNQFYTCPVCKKISGVRFGEMPAGTMTWSYDPHLHISGAPQPGGYTI